MDLLPTHIVENWPGILRVGQILIFALGTCKTQWSGDEERDDQECGKKGDVFVVKSSRNEYHGKTVVFATGSEHRHLRLLGRGVQKSWSFCTALCDGAFYKEKVV